MYCINVWTTSSRSAERSRRSLRRPAVPPHPLFRSFDADGCENPPVEDGDSREDVEEPIGDERSCISSGNHEKVAEPTARLASEQ